MANLYAILILIVLNIFCFFRSLNGFFLADDFSHIDYLHQVFAGHPEMLVQNFFSNWLQAQGTKFFRPFISITLAWDYLFWKNNPIGFHLTNVGLQIASTILLFLIVKRLFPISKNRSFALALSTAALFAVNPLHAEVVSWIIARVDSVAATFLLGAFYLHQRALGKPKRHWANIASFASFLIALLSKETAIILPPVLFLWHFIFPRQAAVAELANKTGSAHVDYSGTGNNYSFINRFKVATSMTWLYWSTLFIYLIYRSLALGTMIGGYGGAVGDGLQNSFWKRWTDPVSIEKVFFPLNDEVFHNSSRLKRYLRWIYQAGAALFVINTAIAIWKKRLALYWSTIIFAAGWFVIAMIPAYQVWNLSANLQGSRFIYMGSIPLSLLLSLIVMPVFLKSVSESSRPPGRTNKIQIAFGFSPLSSAMTAASSAVALAYILVCTHIAQKNDSAWYHASKGVKALYKAMRNELTNMPKDQSIILMNLPFRYQGAHMLYNGFTFGALLRPPFMDEDYSKRVQLFEPIEFGDSDLVNLSRLKTVIQSQKHPLIYQWSEDENKLMPVSLTWAPQKVAFISEEKMTVSGSQVTLSPEVYVATGGVDYLDVELAAQSTRNPDSLKLVWSGPSMTFSPKNFLWAKLERSGDKLKAHFNLSEHKKWLETSVVTRFGFNFLPEQNYVLDKLKLSCGTFSNIPTLTPGLPADHLSGGMRQDQLGMAHPHKLVGCLSYDASNIPEADHVLFQISKPDSWFEQAADTFRSSAKDNAQVAITHYVKALKGAQVTFPSSDLKAPGFYEVRVAAAKKNDEIIGSFSDPINFYLSADDIHASQ